MSCFFILRGFGSRDLNMLLLGLSLNSVLKDFSFNNIDIV